MKFVLFESSETQRVTVEMYESSVLISKEWRKSSDQDWNIGKGITISKVHLLILSHLILCDNEGACNILRKNNYKILKEE